MRIPASSIAIAETGDRSSSIFRVLLGFSEKDVHVASPLCEVEQIDNQLPLPLAEASNLGVGLVQGCSNDAAPWLYADLGRGGI